MATISGELKKDNMLGWIIVNPNDDFVCFLDNTPMENLNAMLTHYHSKGNILYTDAIRAAIDRKKGGLTQDTRIMTDAQQAVIKAAEPAISTGIAHVSDRIEMVSRRVREKLELIEQIKANLTEEGGGLFRSRVHGPDGYVYCNIILTECGEWRLLTSGMAHVKTPHQKTDLDTVVNTILARWH